MMEDMVVKELIYKVVEKRINCSIKINKYYRRTNKICLQKLENLKFVDIETEKFKYPELNKSEELKNYPVQDNAYNKLQEQIKMMDVLAKQKSCTIAQRINLL